jgi:hypothetical protein
MEEVWTDVPGYEGIYEVSNYCKIRNKKTGRMREPFIDSGGYCYIKLSKNGKTKGAHTHTIGMKAFVPNPNNLPCVNHKNESDKTDNFIFINPDGTVDLEKSTLEWCDYSYNAKYGTRPNRIGDKKGKAIIQKTLKGVPVFIWKSASEAEICGFNKYAIYSCLSGKRKSHKGFTFERF